MSDCPPISRLPAWKGERKEEKRGVLDLGSLWIGALVAAITLRPCDVPN